MLEFLLKMASRGRCIKCLFQAQRVKYGNQTHLKLIAGTMMGVKSNQLIAGTRVGVEPNQVNHGQYQNGASVTRPRCQSWSMQKLWKIVKLCYFSVATVLSGIKHLLTINKNDNDYRRTKQYKADP